MKKFTQLQRGCRSVGLLLIFFQVQLVAAQPDYWTTKAALTGHPRMAGAAFSIGNKGFVGLGTDFNAVQSQLRLLGI